MRATGPIHPVRDDGSQLEATFEVTRVPVFDVVFHHKAGARDSPRSVNADYHEALEALLARLAALRARILGISVDSAVARELEPEERELQLEFPIALSPDTDAHELRLAITWAQKPIARRPSAKPGGGNDQKRIRLTIAVDEPEAGLDGLAGALIGPSRRSGSLKCRNGH
jgi:hypothetical protein